MAPLLMLSLRYIGFDFSRNVLSTVFILSVSVLIVIACCLAMNIPDLGFAVSGP